MRNWPRLNRGNLHAFRQKVKELRYVLQMATHDDSDFVKSLGEVKERIGEWHDWEVLAEIAQQMNQHPGCKLLSTIRSTAEQKFEEALSTANHMRKRSLGATAPPRGRSAKAPFSEDAIRSASELAA